MATNLTGPRSIKSKLERLSAELARDGARVTAEYPRHKKLAAELQLHSLRLARTAEGIE